MWYILYLAHSRRGRQVSNYSRRPLINGTAADSCGRACSGTHAPTRGAIGTARTQLKSVRLRRPPAEQGGAIVHASTAEGIGGRRRLHTSPHHRVPVLAKNSCAESPWSESAATSSRIGNTFGLLRIDGNARSEKTAEVPIIVRAVPGVRSDQPGIGDRVNMASSSGRIKT